MFLVLWQWEVREGVAKFYLRSELNFKKKNLCGLLVQMFFSMVICQVLKISWNGMKNVTCVCILLTCHIQSIVHHVGADAIEGHYVTTVAEENGQIWKLFDDSYSKKVGIKCYCIHQHYSCIAEMI